MPNKKGFSLVEVLVSIGIFTLLISSIVWILVQGLRSNRTVWNHLESQQDARRIMREILDDIRIAEESSNGSYPLVTTTPSEIIFYANIDQQGTKERVRYSLEGTDIVRGIVSPSGNPLTYTLANEVTSTIGEFVVNTQEGIDLFSYYGADFTGTENPLSDPIVLTDVRVVRVNVQIEKNPLESPEPFSISEFIHIRNLKD